MLLFEQYKKETKVPDLLLAEDRECESFPAYQ
jgi:hypothetical protein